MIEFLLLCVVVLFFILFVMSGVYDIRSEKQQKRIDELEKENTELYFEIHKRDRIMEIFEKEYG